MEFVAVVLMRALGGREAPHVVGKGIETNRTVRESDVPVLVLPGDGVL
jgi:hypothetical protein